VSGEGASGKAGLRERTGKAQRSPGPGHYSGGKETENGKIDGKLTTIMVSRYLRSIWETTDAKRRWRESEGSNTSKSQSSR